MGGLELRTGRFSKFLIVFSALACSRDCFLLLHQSYQYTASAVRPLRIQHSHLICQSHPSHSKAKLNSLSCHNLFSHTYIPSPNTSAVLFPQLNSGPIFTAAAIQAALAAGKSLFYLAIGLFLQVMPRSVGIMHSPSKGKDGIQRVLGAKFHVVSPHGNGTH